MTRIGIGLPEPGTLPPHEILTFAARAEQVANAAARLRTYAAAADRPMPEISVGLHAVLGDNAVARETRTRMQHELGSSFRLDPDDVSAVMLTGSAEQVAERVAEVVGRAD